MPNFNARFTPAGITPAELDLCIHRHEYKYVLDSFGRMKSLEVMHCVLIALLSQRSTATKGEWQIFLDHLDFDYMPPIWCRLPADEHNTYQGCWGISSGAVEINGRVYCLECDYYDSISQKLDDLVTEQNWSSAHTLLLNHPTQAPCIILEAIQRSDGTAEDKDWEQFKAYLLTKTERAPESPKSTPADHTIDSHPDAGNSQR